MTKKEFLHLASQEYDKWVESQEGQQDGYEYERSFDEFMADFSRRLFQQSLGDAPANKRKKNDSQ